MFDDDVFVVRNCTVLPKKNKGCTVIISSHLLGELEKIAAHYGIIRGGKMLCEMTAQELEADCPTYTALRVKDANRAKAILSCKYPTAKLPGCPLQRRASMRSTL